MSEYTEHSKSDPPPEQMGSDGRQSRQRSTIDFPYVSLEAVEEVVRAIYQRCGLGACDADELAAQMGQSVSGAFRQKTAAARTFGVVEKDGRSSFTLTDIGRKFAVEATLGEGKVEAFLAVPLYRAIYDKYRGHELPPAKALEREMEVLGVAYKQTDKARQAFERSAQYAGFFDSGRERLVKPRTGSTTEPAPMYEQKSGKGAEEDSDGKEAAVLDPIIRGLLERLPKSGAVWPETERKLWIGLLEGSFKLIYSDKDPESEVATLSLPSHKT